MLPFLPARLPTTKAARETYAPASVLIPAEYHARRVVPRIYTYHKEAAADAALGADCGLVPFEAPLSLLCAKEFNVAGPSRAHSLHLYYQFLIIISKLAVVT